MPLFVVFRYFEEKGDGYVVRKGANMIKIENNLLFGKHCLQINVLVFCTLTYALSRCLQTDILDV